MNDNSYLQCPRTTWPWKYGWPSGRCKVLTIFHLGSSEIQVNISVPSGSDLAGMIAAEDGLLLDP